MATRAEDMRISLQMLWSSSTPALGYLVHFMPRQEQSDGH